MRQILSSNDEPITSAITAWYQWVVLAGNQSDGQAEFIVDLIKPDSSSVNLADVTKTPDAGSGNLLNGVDIKTHMSQYGNYELWLTIKIKSAHQQELVGGEYVDSYYQSYGYYDNISIDMTVKKYKTVHEMLGSSGTLIDEAKVTKSEIVSLSEAYSTEVFSPSFNYETASESVGLSESYSKILKRIRGVVEVVGLVEAIQAKRTQGNMETTYVLEDLTQWTEISRVETPWIKTKVEIA